MPPILVIINLVALLVALSILLTVNWDFKKIFLIGMSLPIALWFIVAIALYPRDSWGIIEIIMMLLRGSLILGVFSGALACYIVTKLKQR